LSQINRKNRNFPKIKRTSNKAAVSKLVRKKVLKDNRLYWYTFFRIVWRCRQIRMHVCVKR